jgi:chromate reductase
MGASPGVTGTARAQEQLRQTLTCNGAYVVPAPEVLVGRVDKKVDAAGKFVDQSATPFIRTLLENLAKLSVRLRQ